MYDENRLGAIGRRISVLRFELELSQSELAEKIGISQTHLSNIEHGRVQISLKLLVRVANVMQCSLDDFFGTSPLGPPDQKPGELPDSYTAEEIGVLLQMLQGLKNTGSRSK